LKQCLKCETHYQGEVCPDCGLISYRDISHLSISDAVKSILMSIEGAPLREELLETPRRVQKSFEEMLDGYNVDIDSLLKSFDDEGKDQIVIASDIEFVSLCEHHLLPFTGVAHVGYLPKDKVIGISKIPRLVLAFAHRLQLQERLTKQVAYTLMESLEPHGVAVVTIAEHSCMRCRGVKSTKAKVICSEMIGKFREDIPLRQEFLTLIGLS